jgi:hypothetical protein
MTPIAHVSGIPIEETLGMYGPVLLLVLGAASARARARIRRPHSDPGTDRAARQSDRRGGRSWGWL